MHSVSEAATRLGLTDRHIRFLLRRGELSGRKLVHDWSSPQPGLPEEEKTEDERQEQDCTRWVGAEARRSVDGGGPVSGPPNAQRTYPLTTRTLETE